MSDAQILDRGYRRYEGARSGVFGAMRSVAWHTTRSILGLGRKGRHKVFPIIVIFVSFVPALAFLALTILIGDLLAGELRPDSWEFFGFSFVASLLFTALVAPEAIVRDRSDGMFALYLSTPLSRFTYLVAKVAAVIGTMSIIVLGPVLFALVGFTFQSKGPDGPLDWIGVFGRLVVGGLVICVVYTAVSLGAASLTNRRAFASIAAILLLLGSSIAVNILVEVAEFSPNFLVFDPLSVAQEAPARLFGGRTDDLIAVSTWLVALGCVGWTVLGAGLVFARYRKLAAV